MFMHINVDKKQSVLMTRYKENICIGKTNIAHFQVSFM